MTLAYHRYHGLDTRIVRIFNTYGPRMRLRDGRAVPAFMSQALRGEDESDRCALLSQRLERLERVVGGAAADDLVVASVALELARDPRTRVGIRVDGEDERLPPAGAHWSPRALGRRSAP